MRSTVGYMPHGIAQFYLLRDRGDFHAVPLAEASSLAQTDRESEWAAHAMAAAA